MKIIFEVFGPSEHEYETILPPTSSLNLGDDLSSTKRNKNIIFVLINVKIDRVLQRKIN